MDLFVVPPIELDLAYAFVVVRLGGTVFGCARGRTDVPRIVDR
jgi:hypothetical protein